MKAEFQILKARPKIQVVLNRDSVCAGDDCESHEKTAEVYSFVDPEVFARAISSGYLPSLPESGTLGRVCCRDWQFRHSRFGSRNSIRRG
jgi:hypothetical protein